MDKAYRRPQSLLACLALALCAGASAAPDARLLAAATAAQPAVIDSLEQMVRIESGSGDLNGLAKLADLIDQCLKALGFKTERRKVTSGTGADVVIGSLQGAGKHKIMLQAHMDTVYPSGILATQPSPGKLGRPDSPEMVRQHFRLLREGLNAWMQGRTAPLGMPSYLDFLAGVTAALDHVRHGHHGDSARPRARNPVRDHHRT